MSKTPTPLPLDLFNYVNGLVPRVAVELVVLRDNRSEILLTQRPPDDPYWPAMWHVPGGYILFRESVRDAINRIARNELGSRVSECLFLGYLEFYREEENPRNHSISLIFRCSLENEAKTGEYFPVDTTPSNFIQLQNKIIQLVQGSPQTQPVPLF